MQIDSKGDIAWNVWSYFLGKLIKIFQNAICWNFTQHAKHYYLNSELRNLMIYSFLLLLYPFEKGDKSTYSPFILIFTETAL